MTDVGGFDVEVEHHASEDVADVSVTIYHHGSAVTLHLDEEEADELVAVVARELGMRPVPP